MAIAKRTNYLIKKAFQVKYTLFIVLTLLVVMAASLIGLYMGMWGSIIENFSKFKVSQNLENARRITDYEDARYKRGDYRLDRIFREAELLSAEEKRSLNEALRSVNRSLVPKVALLALALFVGGIFLSHKLAGPMYRIETSAEAIRSGNLRVSFNTRSGDEMKEATSALEGMVETLRRDVEKIKAASVILEDRIDSLASCLPEDEARRMRNAISDIYKVLSRYKT